jgi:uncharacterized membrane protein
LLRKWGIDLDSVLLGRWEMMPIIIFRWLFFRTWINFNWISNACVGGSATAASMAAGSLSRPDLVLSASLAGIVGYIIGTPIALLCFKYLTQWLTQAIFRI